MRPPGRVHRWGKWACLVGAVVCGAAMGVSLVGEVQLWAVVRTGPPGSMRSLWMVDCSAAGGRASVLLASGHSPILAGFFPEVLPWRQGERLKWHANAWWENQSRYILMNLDLPRCDTRIGSLRVELPVLYPLAISGGAYAAMHRRDRRWRRLNSAACPKCTYSLTGLKPDAPCPECGAGRAEG